MTTNTECDRNRLALRVKWWQGEKFGMFIHWGLYAIPGRGEWVMFFERVKRGEYEKLTRHFRPRPGMARQWARLARQAGMRYMVLTTKHHDGFCLFDTKLTDYNSVNSAARRDLVREYVEACRAENLGVGLYYSIREWHHPNAPLGKQHRLVQSDPHARKPDLQKYTLYMRGQLRELLTNYGKIDILWFDGDDPVFDGVDGKTIAKEIRKYQPDILINDRLPGNDPDFFTPEQMTPRKPLRMDGREVPWEACHTLTGMHWGYCSHELEEDLRPAGQLIRMLSAAAGAGGNFMLNVGPRPDGTLPSMVTRRLQAMGAWLRKHGDSIYGTVAGPACHPDYGCLTRRGNNLYLHVFKWPRDGRLPLPAVNQKPIRAALMNGKSLPVRNGYVMAPRQAPNAADSVIVLTFSSPPSCRPVRRLPVSKVDYHVKKGRSVAVNADIEEAVWRKLPVIHVSQDTHYDESNVRFPGPVRRGYCAYNVRAMHANGLLYVDVDVESPTRLVRHEERCMRNCDAVRMFFAANTRLSLCNYTPESFELSIDALGGVWMPREAEFPGGAIFRHAVSPTDRGYTVMLAMPLGMMRRKADDPDTALKPGDRFRFNIMVSQPTPLPAHNETTAGHSPKPWWLSVPPDFTPYAERHLVWWKGSGGDLWTDVQSWGLWQVD